MDSKLTTHSQAVGTVLLLLFMQQAVATEPGINEQFRTLDANQDGRVTEIEVDSRPDVVRYMHLYSNSSFGLADLNDDGSLDEAEFAAFEEEIPAE